MFVPILAVFAVIQTSQGDAPSGADVRAMPNAAVAVRATQAPNIDGRADDAVWRTAPRTTGFRQFEPRIDANPQFETEFQVAFDTRNLYVFVRMHDSAPDSIMHALSRRDQRGPSDQIKLLIDSYDDKRSGFEFAVNPDGVKRDWSISNDDREDGSWNGIWDVATRVDSLGWTAEFRIPLSQLRYSTAENHTFGFGVWRDIERYAERSSWPLYATTRNGLVSQLGRLSGLSGITSARRLEATPYAVTKNLQRTRPGSQYERSQQLTVGGDIKLGITPNVTLDATVNPDFGQVEADPATLNLSAFETFVSERRPFFVEGTGLYQFQLNCYIVVDCGSNEGLFYSRRIGRSPALRDLYGDAATATSTPIAVATKLTGRTRNGLSFGALEAITQEVQGPGEKTVEPGTNFAVLRAQQDLRGGETGISIIGTAVNRSLDKYTLSYLNKSAYSGGATFRNRFHKGEYEVAAQFAASQVNGAQEVIYNLQRNATHYYQQPGDDLSVDSSRTSLTGHAEQLKFGKYGGGITRFESSIVRQSAGFDVNDIGYLRRADLLNWSTWGAINFRDARGIYRWLRINGNHWEQWTTSGLRTDNALNFNGHMGLKNNWDVHLGGTFAGLTQTFCDRCTRGGPALARSSSFSPWGGVNTDARKVISTGIWINYTRSDEGKTDGISYGPYVNLRFSTRFQANIGTSFGTDNVNTQWFGNFKDGANVMHYTFAHLDQRVSSMNMRLNYTVTPNLTFEFYGQPFVAKGSYTNIREVSTTPEAKKYDDRFVPFTPPATAQTAFQSTQLNSNAVVRWEYRPGSTLFVVWAHGRQNSAKENLSQPWTRDYRDLFDLHPNNTFLIKFAYWLNR